MQENFFLSCTETPKQTLNVQMFDDIRYMNSDLQFDQSNSTDLSLKLRGTTIFASHPFSKLSGLNISTAFGVNLTNWSIAVELLRLSFLISNHKF